MLACPCSDINDVIPVGGPGLVCQYRCRKVAEFLVKREPRKDVVNPDEAVAIGAAVVQGGVLTGET